MSHWYDRLPLDEVRRHVKNYQQTRDPRSLWALLAKFDNLILNVLHQLKRRYAGLNEEANQDLYHVGIIGLHEGVLKLPDYDDPKKIAMWVAAYIKSAIVRTFRYRIGEIIIPANVFEIMKERSCPSSDKTHRKMTARLDFDNIIKASDLTDIEELILRRFFEDGRTKKQIMQETGIARTYFVRHFRSAVTKIKSALDSDGIRRRSRHGKRRYEYNNRKGDDMILAVDFDGTLVEHSYPEIGKPIEHVLNFVKESMAKGNQFILYTCRGGKYLQDAIGWCVEHGIEPDAVNEDVEEVKKSEFGRAKGTKPFAHMYIDDRAVSPEFLLQAVVSLKKVEEELEQEKKEQGDQKCQETKTESTTCQQESPEPGDSIQA